MRERRHDLDWLRIVAVLLLIYFHSARIFDFDRFYVKNPEPSFWLAVFIMFLNCWHMPLFFLVSARPPFTPWASAAAGPMRRSVSSGCSRPVAEPRARTAPVKARAKVNFLSADLALDICFSKV